MDPECAVCHALQEATDNLKRICDFILLSQPKSKKDFGLHKSLVERHMGSIAQMQNYHEYFHATGESLSDANSRLNSTSGDEGPPQQRPRRFRPS